MEALCQLLRSYQNDGVHHTHVSMVRPKGRFNLNRKGIEEFWGIYQEMIHSSTASGNLPVVGIAEKPPKNYMPVLVDIDIKVKYNDGDVFSADGLYTRDQVESVIGIYQSVLRKIVEDCTDEKLICIFLSKDPYILKKGENTYLKHGFHLHFPYCFLNPADQEVHLIPRVQEVLKQEKTFGNLGVDNSGDVIDKQVCSVPWLVYGSRKDEEARPYLVSRVYNSELEEVDLEKTFARYSIYDDKEKLIKIKGRVQEFLPRILSIVPYGRETSSLKHGLISPLKEIIKKREKKVKSEYQTKTAKEDLEIAKKLLPMLADHRVDDYNMWMRIGWALFNISDGSAEGLEMWCDFSARNAEKFDEGVCIYEWEKMVKKDITLGTLRQFASIDSPTEYRSFKQEQAVKHRESALNGSHNDIARILYEYYGDEFVCASITGKLWFQFVNHKWEQIEEGVFLRQKLSEEVVEIFKKQYYELSNKMVNSDKSEIASLNVKAKQIQKIIQNLKSATFKRSVMIEAMDVFYDKRFKDKLDMNAWIIAFKNGVYDLKLNEFRAGSPEDYLSKCMPIDFIDYSEDDDKVLEIHSFLEKIFPDPSIRTYFMDVASDVFVGGNTQKNVIFWTGEGDNGKSITQSFFEQMMGPLAIKFDTNIITGKKQASGSASPELARAGGGVRWAVLEEPNNDEQINVGTLKHLSGGDTYYARDLFEKGKDGREIRPMFKLTFITNKLPKLKHSDKATWNRIRVIPFESTFCKPDDPAPELYEEQIAQKRFPMDKHFNTKIPGLLPAMAWVLLNHRKNIKVRFEPDRVRDATNMYRKQNDTYRQFVDENIVDDESKSIGIIEIYGVFKDWFKESMPSVTMPLRSDVEEYFTKTWGEPKGKSRKWSGRRFRSVQDDKVGVDSGLPPI